MEQMQSTNTKTYSYGEGFFIDIVTSEKDTYNGKPLREAWLYFYNYGIKVYMFGSYEAEDEFIKTVEASAPEDIEIYKNDYPEIEDSISVYVGKVNQA